MNARLTYLAIVMGALLAGCNDDVVNSYSAYSTLPPDGWRYDDVRSFAVTHRDSVCTGTLLVALRHRGDYPYTDIQLEVDYTDQGEEKRDTVTVALADRYGKWLGKGVGYSFQVADTVGPLTHTTGMEVRIHHLMRCDTLPGVSQIGVFFVP